MNSKEIAAFNAGCELESREDGVYVKRQELTEWAGPYESAIDALRFYRLVFSVL